MFVELAREYNLIEGTPSFRKFIDNYNSAKLTSYKMSYTDSWCACFVSWIVYKTNIPLKKSVSVHEFKNLNKDYFIPFDKLDKFKFDDILIIDWGKGTGHIGFVGKECSKYDSVYYISGNSNNRVRFTYANYKDCKILGVVRYKFEKSNLPKVEILTTTFIRDIDTLKSIGVCQKGTIGYFQSIGIKGNYERGILLDINTKQPLFKGCIAKSNRTIKVL